MSKIDFIDLFGGIGGFPLGLQKASDRFNKVGYYEKDKYAVKSYNRIFGENHNPTDITTVPTGEIPDHDLLCAGFPCQSFSIAGNRKGTEDERGKLFHQIVRIAEAKEPEMLLLENVKGLLSQKAVRDGEPVPGTKGHAFREILTALHELGYFIEWKVLNSKRFGVPQNRERVFIIGHLGGEPQRKVFPLRRENREDTAEDGGQREIKNIGNVNPSGKGMNGQVYEASEETVAPTLTTNKGEGHKIAYGEHHQDMLYTEDSVMGCLRANGNAGHFAKIIQQNQREEVVQKNMSGAIHEYMSNNQAPKVIDWRGHENKLPVERDEIPTLRSESHGHQPKILQNHRNLEVRDHGQTNPTLNKKQGGGQLPMVAQIPRGDNTGGLHEVCPTVSSNSWEENNFLKQVQPVHTPEFADKDMNMKSRVGSEDGSMFTVDGTSQHGIKQSKRIRKLTPKECWRLQGFPDWAFEKAEEVNSDTQLYKQAGNAVTVNVIEHLGKELEGYF